MQDSKITRIPLQVTQGCVMASIQIDLAPDILEHFRDDLLEAVQKNRARGVILEVSALEVMDLEDFNALHETMKMVSLMGAHPVLAGLQAGVVSTLLDLGADIENLRVARNLDDALRILQQDAE